MDKKKLIGIFAVEASSRIQCSLYRELHEKAKQLGYNLVLFSGENDRVKMNKTALVSMNLFALAEYMDFAAFIIHAQSLGNLEMIRSIIKMGQEKNIPVFAYDCETVGVTKADGVIPIILNYKQGFSDSVRHLIEHHHCKNIYMLAGVRNNKYSDDRVEMYRLEMASHGLLVTEDQIGYGDFWEVPAMKAVNTFLDSGRPVPEAICCANDSMAVAAAKVLQERGFRVPEDVLITGFDGIEDAKYNMPAISTCEPELKVAAEFVFEVLEGNCQEKELLVPLIFYPKESCGCSYTDSVEDKKEIVRLIENSRQTAWQNHMFSTMQSELIDSFEVSEIVGYMNGILNLFEGYTHVFCIREALESLDEYESDFVKMQILMNQGLLPQQEYDPFGVEKIVPAYEKVFEQAGQDELFIFRLIHCVDKKYGYAISRSSQFNANEIKLHGQFVESITNVIESLIRNRRLRIANQKLNEMYERMAEIHIRDMMTNLYNRNGYYQVLGEYLEREEMIEEYLHVIAIDMDNMKSINDHYGHLEGDIAIQAVAKAITDCIKHPCVCARFGGDEFEVAIFTETAEEPSAEKIARKMNNYLKNAEMLADKEYKVEVSAGQSVIKVVDLRDLKQIEKLADDAMYEQKRRRKNGEII